MDLASAIRTIESCPGFTESDTPAGEAWSFVLAQLGLQGTVSHPGPNLSQLSDGYHTFEELYQHRHSLCLALMKAMPTHSWFSRYHADGEKCFGGDDWFIVGIDLPGGQGITYHLPSELYSMAMATDASELPLGRPWDGHTAADVVTRLRNWTALIQPEPEAAQVNDDAWKEFIDQIQKAQHIAAREGECPVFDLVEMALALRREATLQPSPVPVPVAERPWEREGWCDAEGFCWEGTGWAYDDANEREGYAMWVLVPGNNLRGDVSLPHNALPVPGAEVG